MRLLVVGLCVYWWSVYAFTYPRIDAHGHVRPRFFGSEHGRRASGAVPPENDRRAAATMAQMLQCAVYLCVGMERYDVCACVR